MSVATPRAFGRCNASATATQPEPETAAEVASPAPAPAPEKAAEPEPAPEKPAETRPRPGRPELVAVRAEGVGRPFSPLTPDFPKADSWPADFGDGDGSKGSKSS